jgi:hypothetical protein
MATEQQRRLLKAMEAVALPLNDVGKKRNLLNNEEPSEEDLESELERLYLAPDQKFSEEWLNKLQQYMPVKIFAYYLTDDGICHSSLIHCSCPARQYHDHEYVLSGRVSREE